MVFARGLVGPAAWAPPFCPATTLLFLTRPACDPAPAEALSKPRPADDDTPPLPPFTPPPPPPPPPPVTRTGPTLDELCLRFRGLAGGVVPTCSFCWCRRRRSRRAKQRVHSGHSKGFSFVWERSWRLRCSRRANERPHVVHTWGLGLSVLGSGTGAAAAAAVVVPGAVAVDVVVGGAVDRGLSEFTALLLLAGCSGCD